MSLTALLALLSSLLRLIPTIEKWIDLLVAAYKAVKKVKDEKARDNAHQRVDAAINGVQNSSTKPSGQDDKTS